MRDGYGWASQCPEGHWRDGYLGQELYADNGLRVTQNIAFQCPEGHWWHCYLR
jgi:hypothetical protein